MTSSAKGLASAVLHNITHGNYIVGTMGDEPTVANSQSIPQGFQDANMPATCNVNMPTCWRIAIMDYGA